ncbi:AfsR/SARP family transcriptional regulator [Saccharomonospora piscinae]|uniref:AfsR/SARP family transcriptional regulator n=1 Tax=Saccharomonospora piscinae TaxID=687388 RepID=UPI000464A986|nr:AfsR/SARP family transcriptional regulator [Saccharomonospora piscinae]
MWEIRVLGPVEVRREGIAVPVNARMLRAVLASLAIRANEVVSHHTIRQDLWGPEPPASARPTVRNYVRRLRSVLGSDVIDTAPSGYRISTPPHRVDMVDFEDRIRRGTARGVDPEERHRLLADALRLWRGGPLADLDGLPVTEHVVLRLHERYLLAVEAQAAAALVLGEHEPLLPQLRELVAHHPTREGLVAQFMQVLHRSGRRGEALETYLWVRRRLVDELGMEPGAELRRVHRHILDDAQAPAEPEQAATVTAPSHAGARAQLPMDIAEFTGRVRELSQLLELADLDGARSSTAARVVAITGMPGSGKTRLAVHLAHRLVERGQYPDIQLWSDLRGFDRSAPPTRAGDALNNLLRLLGVPGARIPVEEEARAALFRSTLAGKRALLLLDNVADEEQIRPLLPADPSCLVIVTSRRSLSGLDGLRSVPLDVMPEAEAVDLLRRVAGASRVPDDTPAVRRVARLCGFLPIALALAARRLRDRPVWTVNDLVHRLDSTDRRLTRLSVGDRDLRTVFDVSYRALAPEHQRLFRLLGLHPGEEITPPAAAALANVPVADADDALESLVDEQLLQQPTAQRYRFHDLVRVYAREVATADESPADRATALDRLYAAHLHTAVAARELLASQHGVPFPLARPGGVPGAATFATRDEALTWCETELGTLSALARHAAAHGPHPVAWQLPAVLLTFYYLRSHWTDWITTHEIGLESARTLGDLRGQALLLRGLGVAKSDLRRFTESVECHRRAQEAFEACGDLAGSAWNLNNLGVVQVDRGQLTDAAANFRAALDLFRRVGDTYGEGICLNNAGDTERRRGRPEQAETLLHEALTVLARIGAEDGHRFTYASLGDLHRDRDDHSGALHCYRRAAEAARAAGDQRTAARADHSIGDCLHALGDPQGAREHWRTALTTFDTLGDPQAAALRARVPSDPSFVAD